MPLLVPDNLKREPHQARVIGWTCGNLVCVLALVEEWMVDRNAPTLIQSIHTASKRYPFGSISILGQLDELYTLQSPVIHYRPPDASRLQYLIAKPGGMATGTEKAGVGEIKSARGITVQDGYGVAARGRRRDEICDILAMINETRSAQRDIALLNPSRRSYVPAAATVILGASYDYAAIICSWTAVAIAPVAVIADWTLNLPKRLGIRSNTTTQLLLRLDQLRRVPHDFSLTLPKSGVELEQRSWNYMRFWNTVWLVLNDLLIGFTIYSIVSLNIAFLARHIENGIKVALVQWPVDALVWLDDWPVGLKLNTPLSHFYRTSLLTAITYWADTAIPYTSHLPFLLHLLSLSSLLGATLCLAMLQDLISIFTLHLRIAHRLTLAICTYQLDSLGGLWNLFRGKRWNVLRQRTDSYPYDVDQLFLGTLAFVVEAFLAPTVLVYAGLFWLIEVVVLLTSRALQLGQTALNAFPLFELLLRIKEPSRLPSGVFFELEQSSSPSLRIRNAPKSFMSILLHRNPRPPP